MSIIKEEYSTVQDALNEAKHWLRNSMTTYLARDEFEKVQGMMEAIKYIEIFLSRVKK